MRHGMIIRVLVLSDIGVGEQIRSVRYALSLVERVALSIPKGRHCDRPGAKVMYSCWAFSQGVFPNDNFTNFETTSLEEYYASNNIKNLVHSFFQRV